MTTTLAPHSPLADLLPAARAFLERTPALFIGGRWVPAASGGTFPTHNPADGSVLAQIASGDREDIDRAAKAARAAFERGPWSRMAPSERGKLLWRLADLIDAHADELAQLETLDNGKPLRVALASDIPGSAEMFRYMAGWATKLEGTTLPLRRTGGPPRARGRPGALADSTCATAAVDQAVIVLRTICPQGPVPGSGRLQPFRRHVHNQHKGDLRLDASCHHWRR